MLTFEEYRKGGIVLPKLGYDYGSVARFVGKRTMELHHKKHHGSYVKNLNDLIASEGITETDPFRLATGDYPEGVTDNAGGHVNHSLFWRCVSPDGGAPPSGEIKSMLLRQFTTYADFKHEFSMAAAEHFGSGWVWATVSDGDIVIERTENQDVPEGRPLIGLDVWEHAYYLDYQNDRRSYISSFWSVVKWPEII
jgi:Fe-Mn family superoxide dismutase